MDYREAEDYLYSLPRLGLKHGQKNVQTLLDRWGNPERELRCIQVAGTNGKGSVTTMIASVLHANGFHTGRYVSPHLDRLTERIQVDGKDIPEEELARLVSEAKELGHSCTFFEVMTAVALKYFRGKTDYCVLEVGLGGRLDATSVVTPLVGVITNVDFDHTHILGDTLEEIAFEKVGIIKPGMTVITSERKPRAIDTIRKIASERGASLIEVSEAKYRLAMRGCFQQWNAACAVEAVKALGENLEPTKGLSRAMIPGRMEKHGNLLMDVAHNAAGIRALKETLGDLNYRKLFVVFGVKKDKDVGRMVELLPPTEELILTKYRVAPNGMEPEEIARQTRGRRTVIAKDVKSALKRARKAAGDRDLVVVTGSTFLVSEARGASRQICS